MQIAKVKQSCARQGINEEIEVAIFFIITACSRTKDTRVSSAILHRQRTDCFSVLV